MDKRQFLQCGAGAAAALAWPLAGAQAPDKLTVIGHAAHRSALTGEKGGDIAGDWSKANNSLRVEWITFGVPEIHDRLFREASLSAGAIDVAFLLNRYVSARVATLFEPLDDLQKQAPVEAMDDYPRGMLDTLTFGGKLYGIPFRQATTGLLYNKALLAERGLSGPPKTTTELLDYAKKLSYTRADGTRVHGLIMDGPGISQMIDLARMYDGDLVGPDMKIKVTEPGMVRALGVLKDLYEGGVLPRDFPKFQTENVVTFMQQGRAAMALTPLSRYTQFNSAQASRFPGQIEAAPIPVADELKSRYDFAPVKSEFWVLAIPRNARNKQLSWNFIRQVSSKEATIRAGLNGNGPARRSAMEDARYRGAIPYAQAEAAVLRHARPPLPGWENSARAEDAFREEVEAMLVGNRPPADTARAIARRVEPLLPK
ncbi:MAG TPA: extracellular solute-binding protein [Ramlibacter sp.]|nr:extracellular solute-binding protein [Ramlibacter sp.]